MNNLKISGTTQTKRLIGAIIKDFGGLRTNNMHIDYKIGIKSKNMTSELLTHEQKGEFREISLIRLNNNSIFNHLDAAIGNNTGNILIERKPRFMSRKKALKEVIDFLTSVQPKALEHPNSSTVKSTKIGDVKNRTISAEFDSFQMEKTVDGNNSMHSFEVHDAYKNL